ncbi:lipopolysaccharide biosynthesis protein [Shumkonia mesophila]|uniref:lipopolysaccharide biosynthesis protein n=1 Tax=Shumkonia mesophila TaxID=2838854 RepID=UPI00293446E6|nr:hypothetical protein [Shumkonia mesophila]
MTGAAEAGLRALWSRLANNPDYTRSVVTSYGSVALNVLVQLVLVPLYLAYLGKHQFGILMIVLGAINYLNIGVGWASSGTQRIIGEMAAVGDRDGLAEAYGMSKLLFVGYALAIAGLALGGVSLAQGMVDPAAGIAYSALFDTVAIASAYFVVAFDFNLDRVVLVASGHQAKANVMAILNQAVFAVVAILLLRQGYGLPGVMTAFLCGAAVARGVSWWALSRQGIRWRWPGGRGRQVLKRLVGHMGLGYAVYGGLIMTLLQADVLILGWLGGAKLVADFVLIWKIADVGMQALWRIPESLQPYIVQMDVRNEEERLRRIYRQGQVWMTGIAAVAAVGYAAFGPTVVRLWVGAENAPDAPWAFVLAGGAIFWLVSARLPAIFAFSLLRLRPLNIAIATEVAVKIALLLVLFPVAGYYSPLIAVNAAHLGGVAILYRRLARQVKERTNGRTVGP